MKFFLNIFKSKRKVADNMQVDGVLVEKAVENNLKKFSKTYKLLEEYDKNPSQPPKVSPKSSALRDYIQKS